jgi:hypothetical protein
MKHTPGPWVVNDFCTEGGADTAVWTSHDPHTAKSICECHFETHANMMRGETGCHQLEAEANAKLIAAAPELLSELRDLVAFHDHGDDEALVHTLARARAAIAKATE